MVPKLSDAPMGESTHSLLSDTSIKDLAEVQPPSSGELKQVQYLHVPLFFKNSYKAPAKLCKCVHVG